MSRRRKDSPPPVSPRPPLLLPTLALFALTLLAFAPSIPGQFIWDDDDYVQGNPNLRHDAGLIDIWFHPTHNPQYYPLVFTTFWLEWRIWGESPIGYRVVNILLHAASATLLWRLLKRLEVPGAYLAAAIFAIHPVTTESVAWITERKNTLSLFFYLASMRAYLRFADVAPRIQTQDSGLSTQDSKRWGLYPVALLFFILALLSKTVTATLPAAILLILWWKRDRIDWRHAALLAPFFVFGIAAGLHTGHLERHHVGAHGPEWNWSFIDRILIASRAVCFYAAKLLAPVNLSFIYPRWNIDPRQWWQWLFPIPLLVMLATLFALRHRIGRGPLAAALFFIGTLFPALGFVNVFPMRYSFVADHFQYHASIGLIALVAALFALAITRYARQWLASSRDQRLAGATLVLLLSALTFQRSRVFASPDRLWQDTLAKNPTSWMAWTNLGHLAADRNDHQAAADAYRKAHALAPHLLDTRFNLALLHAREGNPDRAIAELQQIVKEEPRHANARHQLARLLTRQGKPQEAIAHLESALNRQKKNPDFRHDLATAHREIANQHIQQRNYGAAETSLRKVLDLRPNDAVAIFDLATVLALTNRHDQAAALYAKAIQLKPDLRNRLPR